MLIPWQPFAADDINRRNGLFESDHISIKRISVLVWVLWRSETDKEFSTSGIKDHFELIHEIFERTTKATSD